MDLIAEQVPGLKLKARRGCPSAKASLQRVEQTGLATTVLPDQDSEVFKIQPRLLDAPIVSDQGLTKSHSVSVLNGFSNPLAGLVYRAVAVHSGQHSASLKLCHQRSRLFFVDLNPSLDHLRSVVLATPSE